MHLHVHVVEDVADHLLALVVLDLLILVEHAGRRESSINVVEENE